MSRLLSADEMVRQLGDLPAWQRDGKTLRRDVVSAAFADAIRIVTDVAEVAEQMDHHPDIDIRWTRLTFALTTHSEGGITQLDIELAHRIDEISAEHGAK